jgi:hypothetical protein
MYRFYYIFILFIIATSVNATDMVNNDQIKADCLILKDENSIICKYTHERINEDKKVKFEWIEPNNTISRVRELIIPAGHGSIYDYRYIKGRTKGNWTFKVIDGDLETKANFIIE